MGMNIAGGYEQVKKDAAAVGISADDLARAKRGDAGFFAAAANDARARPLGVFSHKTGLPDGLGMNISEGYQKLQQDAANLQIPAQDKMESDRYLAIMGAIDAAALASRGKSNPNKGVKARNDAVTKLGEEIGSAVMGEEVWAQYIITSSKDMMPQDKPFPDTPTSTLAKSRSPGERDGWVFHHAAVTEPRWCMTDMITYRLPDHTEENPQLYMETFQAAISQAYHRKWQLHSKMVNKNQKDKDAGKQLYRR